MRQFAEQFFTYFGATISPHPHRQDELIVTLTPELITLFQKPTLYLIIPESIETAPPLSPEEDLLIYGSSTFDKMLTLLEGKGTAVHWQIPAPPETTIPLNPSFPFPLDNCQIQENNASYQTDPFFIFNFRVRFSSDQQDEQIKSIAMDSNGQENNQIATYLSHTLLRSKVGHPFSYPAAKKQERYQIAATYLNDYMEDEIDRQEKEIAPRREKRVRTLNNYYQKLIQMIKIDSESYENSRQQLIDDLAAKIKEEQERYQLYIQSTPISHAILSVPAIIHETILKTNHTEQTWRFIHPLHEEQPIPFLCHHCHEPVSTISLCDHHHLVHHHCFASCSSCGLDVCFSCGIDRCAISAELTCADCNGSCTYCDRWFQKEQINLCPICNQPHCPDHATQCNWCEQSYCSNCHNNQTCLTCEAILQREKPTRTPPISDWRYQWKKKENGRFTIYIGFGSGVLRPFTRPQIIVDDLEGRRIIQKKRNWLQK